MLKLALAGFALLAAAPALADPPSHGRQWNGHGYQSQSHDRSYGYGQRHGESYGYTKGHGYNSYSDYRPNRHARKHARRHQQADHRQAHREERRHSGYGYGYGY